MMFFICAVLLIQITVLLLIRDMRGGDPKQQGLVFDAAEPGAGEQSGKFGRTVEVYSRMSKISIRAPVSGYNASHEGYGSSHVPVKQRSYSG